MTWKLLVAAAASAGFGAFFLAAQAGTPPAVYTDAQAAAGRSAYQSTCGKCHTDTLLGRKGEAGEFPPVSSIPLSMQTLAKGKIPPLAGPDFMAKWGSRTTKELAVRIDNAIGGFPPDKTDGSTFLNLTAYVLEMNGAPPGAKPLTKDTEVRVHSVVPAELMPAAKQNTLVQKYCTVCHTDAVPNGGLSLSHFDAAHPDPTVAAMLVSKLKGGALGASGRPLPDRATEIELSRALTAEAVGASSWTVNKIWNATANTSILSASIVQKLSSTSRDNQGEPDVYRLTLTCNTETRAAEMRLAWSPGVPKTGQTIPVSWDAQAALGRKIEGSEKMGNGAAGTSGPGDIVLFTSSQSAIPLPTQSLTAGNPFAEGSIVFPFDTLSQTARQSLTACLSGNNP